MSDDPFPTVFEDFGRRAGKEYSTTVIRTFGGWEFRNINWPGGLRRWRVVLSAFSEAQRTTILNFVDARSGAGDTFLYTDPQDGTGPYRARFGTDRSEIEARFYNANYWPDLPILEVRES